MSVFTTKTQSGLKTTVVAANIAFVTCDEGKATIHFAGGAVLPTDVGYDSVRRNVAKALATADSAEVLGE